MNAVANAQTRLVAMENTTYCLSVLKLDPGSEKLSMQSGLKCCGANGGTILRVLAGQAFVHQ